MSFALRAGIVTTLVGPNGAGKTTLFNLITGQSARRQRRRALARRSRSSACRTGGSRALGIGRTFQDLKLFDHMTVLENVLAVDRARRVAVADAAAVARERERRERAEAALEAVAASPTDATRARVDLAYAERKFLSIARILAPARGCGCSTSRRRGSTRAPTSVSSSLLRDQVGRGITICIIEHNLDIVQGISDRIAFLDQGRLLAEGDPQDDPADPRARRDLFRRARAMTSAPVLEAAGPATSAMAASRC